MLWRLVKYAVTTAFTLGLSYVVWIYSLSQDRLTPAERPVPFVTPIPQDTAAFGRGEHLVLTRGCGGCHGEGLGGQVLWGYAVAPNLPKLAREISAADFEAALRHGIDHDGKAMYSMPSFNFLRLRDADVADIIAYLRAAPVVERELPRASLPWSIRQRLAFGMELTIVDVMDRVPPLEYAGEESARARGEYLAMTTCNECHGLTLSGDPPFGDPTAPDLAVIAGYDDAAFTKLMRTGKALGNRELPMMSGVARGRFVHLTDGEVSDLLVFLKERLRP